MENIYIKLYFLEIKYISTYFTILSPVYPMRVKLVLLYTDGSTLKSLTILLDISIYIYIHCIYIIIIENGRLPYINILPTW